MTFAREMAEAKIELENNGYEVFVPRNLDDFLTGTPDSEKKDLKIKLDVFKDYFNEISTADAVLVLNYEKKNIPGYVGVNALIEMAFAHVQDKKIFLFNQIPTMDYSDEIEALQPIVLDGHLGHLNNGYKNRSNFC